MTQEQVATTQALVARLESGRVKPSTRTLGALCATNTRLRIRFHLLGPLASSSHAFY